MRPRVAVIVAVLTLLIILPFAIVINQNAKADAAVPTQTMRCQTIKIIGVEAKLLCPGGRVVEVTLPRETPVVDCDVVVGNRTRVVCKALGQTILSQRLELPTVTLPPVRVTITAPPRPVGTATRTVTVRPEAAPAPPPPTKTVTVRPDNNAEQDRPDTPTATSSITVDGTTPSSEPKTETRTVKEPGETQFETVVKKVGWGALASLGIFLLGIIAYLVGYRLGFGDGKKDEIRSTNRWMVDALKRIRRS